MAQLIEFIGNHLALVAALLGVLVALVITLFQGGGSSAVTPQQAVLILNREDAVPVDLRAEAEYKAGHIINAVNVGAQDIAAGAARLEKFKSRPLLLYCENGRGPAAAVKTLRKLGYSQVHSLQGGLAAWRGEHLPVNTNK